MKQARERFDGASKMLTSQTFRSRLTPTLLISFAALLVAPTADAVEVAYRRDAKTVANSGLLFLDGQYIAPPYAVGWDLQSGLIVNGHELGRQYLGKPVEASPAGDSGSIPQRRRFFARMRSNRVQTLQQLSEIINATLLGDARSVVVLEKGCHPILLDSYEGSPELLLAIHTRTLGASLDEMLDSIVLTDSDRAHLAQFVTDLEITPELDDRVRYALDISDQIVLMNESNTEKTAVLDQYTYPLTIFAMICVACGFGHLLQHKPVLESTGDPQTDSSRQRTIVMRSLLIFVFLSAVDLIWTMLASHTGSMRELNPLGNGLLSNPTHLIAFKSAVVMMSAGILYVLHQRSVAQMASWWGCLVLTLLTARWLIFNSMFM